MGPSEFSPIVSGSLCPEVDAYYYGPFLPPPRMEMPSVFVVPGGRVVCAYTGAYRTFNRWSLVIVGVTPQPGGYPSVKGFVCPCAHHHRWPWRPSSSGKAFFLSSHSLSLKWSSPATRHTESHAWFLWLVLQRLFATGTMVSLIT